MVGHAMTPRAAEKGGTTDLGAAISLFCAPFALFLERMRDADAGSNLDFHPAWERTQNDARWVMRGNIDRTATRCRRTHADCSERSMGATDTVRRVRCTLGMHAARRRGEEAERGVDACRVTRGDDAEILHRAR